MNLVADAQLCSVAWELVHYVSVERNIQNFNTPKKYCSWLQFIVEGKLSDNII